MDELVTDSIGSTTTVLRVYANRQTSNLITAPHHDDLEQHRFTFLYYPHTLSAKEGGETFFYYPNGTIRLVKPSIADTAVLFDSRVRHVGRPPTNACKQLRITVAYKLSAVTTESDSID